MIFEIRHITRYQYNKEVFLEPHTVQLRPRCDVAQSLRLYRLTVTPTPAGIAHCIEVDGNNAESIWFSKTTDKLVFDVDLLVETHRENPFDFVLTDENCLTIPICYSKALAKTLVNYLDYDAPDPLVDLLVKEVARTTKHSTIAFLTGLTKRIFEQIEYAVRKIGEPMTPAATIVKGSGSCRDFAVLFIAACRSVGIASRFVSGYCYTDSSLEFHMHAWAEVYLPGAGWIGFDPSRGFAVTNDYIAVAAGRSFVDAAPSQGTFRGEAEAAMTTEISMKKYEPDDLT